MNCILSGDLSNMNVLYFQVNKVPIVLYDQLYFKFDTFEKILKIRPEFELKDETIFLSRAFKTVDEIQKFFEKYDLSNLKLNNVGKTGMFES